jgi:hypothetical protein
MIISKSGRSGKVHYSSFVSEKVDETHVNAQEFVDIIRDKDCPCLGKVISKDIKGNIFRFTR